MTRKPVVWKKKKKTIVSCQWRHREETGFHEIEGMFSSSGYFRGINCPFYSNGLCERPCCHFRHSRNDDKRDSPIPSKSSREVYPSSTAKVQVDYGSNEVDSYSTSTPLTPCGPVEAYSTSPVVSQNERDSGVCIPSFTGHAKDLPESNEEPVLYSMLPKISGLAKPRRKMSTGSALSYKPTPKVKPQVYDAGDIPSYKPTPIDHLSKRKHSQRVIEYDPVNNYAVAQGKAPSDSEEEEEAVEDSGKDGDRAAGCHAKFSDSESEECVQSSLATPTSRNLDFIQENQPNKDSIVPNYAELLTPSSFFTRPLSYSEDNDAKETSEHSVKSSPVNPVSSDKTTNSRDGSDSKHSEFSKKNHKYGAVVHRKDSSSVSTSDSTSKNADFFQSRRHSSENTKKGSSYSSSKDSNRSSKSSSSSSSSKDKSYSSHKESHISSSKGSERSSSRSSTASIKSPHHDSHKSNKSKERRSSSESQNKNEKSSSSDKRKDSSSKAHTQKSGSSKSPSISSSSNHRSKDKNSSLSAEKHKSKSDRSSKSSSERCESSDRTKSIQKNSSSHRKSVDDKNVFKDELSSHKHVSVSDKDKNGVDVSRTHSTKKERDKTYSKSVNSNSDNRSVIKHERQTSLESKHEEKRLRKTSDDTRKKVVNNVISVEERENISRLGELNTHLFGDSEDSDVEIIIPPPEPPPEVLELTDSDMEEEVKEEEDLSSMTDEVDLLTDSDTFDECLKIFQENEKKMAAAAKRQKNMKENIKQETEANQLKNPNSGTTSVGKKRMAHKAAINQVTRKPSMTPRPQMSPAEVMHNRILEMQKRALLKAARREGREAELPGNLGPSKPKVARPNPFSSPTKSAVAVSMLKSTLSEAAETFLTHQKRRTAHASSSTQAAHTPNDEMEHGSPTTPVKSSANLVNQKSALWSPKSFYSKNKPPGESLETSNGVPARKKVTMASTASKTTKRKAHEPTLTNLTRPLIPAEFGSKVPTNVRQRYLNLIIDDLLKFSPEQTAFDRAQEEEKQVYARASNKNIYLRLAVNCIKRLRTEGQASQPGTSSAHQEAGNEGTMTHKSQSHAATLGGALAARTSFTLNRLGARAQIVDFKGAELYERLEKYILSEKDLKDNGFPRPSDDGSSQAKFYKKEEQSGFLKDNERICRRCGHRFYVNKDGEPVTFEECVYHYGNAYKKKYAGSIDSRYACCNERAGTKGCQVAKCHVHERNKKDNLTGYMRTMPDSDSRKNKNILSLDCEMVYTKAGMELARVTVIDDECKVVYETLVKPDSEIIDYNTRFSGLTEGQMRGVSTTLRGVQAIMLSMISDKTILMGHSLESDLIALKLIHSTVVDTSLAFPHRLGLPYKRALRNLMVEYLQKIIQADDGGHDSKEDAQACMQLMKYKVKQDAKREVRRV